MTIEIQAPYRLILAESPQQVMALQTYIQAAYTLEFNARIPHFLPCLLGLYRADGVLSVPAASIRPAMASTSNLSIWSNIWSSLSRPPSRPVSGYVRPATASSKWAILPAANRVTPA